MNWDAFFEAARPWIVIGFAIGILGAIAKTKIGAVLILLVVVAGAVIYWR